MGERNGAFEPSLSIFMFECGLAGGYNHSMKLDRKRLLIQKLGGIESNEYVNASMRERVALVWEITREICSLSPYHDAERRLQRHIVGIARTRS